HGQRNAQDGPFPLEGRIVYDLAEMGGHVDVMHLARFPTRRLVRDVADLALADLSADDGERPVLAVAGKRHPADTEVQRLLQDAGDEWCDVLQLDASMQGERHVAQVHQLEY